MKQAVCKELNINVYDYDNVRIEQDHFPLTLWDIVQIIGNKMISELEEGQYLTIFDIASTVMIEHLKEENYIGTVSLTTSHHQLRHNGIVNIKKEDINGNYQAFIKKYKKYINIDIQHRIDSNLESLKK